MLEQETELEPAEIVTDTGESVAVELTSNDVDDGAPVGSLLDQVEGAMASVSGDGAYAREDVYGAVAARHPDASVIVASFAGEGAELR